MLITNPSCIFPLPISFSFLKVTPIFQNGFLCLEAPWLVDLSRHQQPANGYLEGFLASLPAVKDAFNMVEEQPLGASVPFEIANEEEKHSYQNHV